MDEYPRWFDWWPVGVALLLAGALSVLLVWWAHPSGPVVAGCSALLTTLLTGVAKSRVDSRCGRRPRG